MVTTTDYGSSEAAMQQYFREGRERALALGNRGPARFTAAGKLVPEIIESYNRHGFYVFEKFIATEELAELETDFLGVMDRAPVAPHSPVDRHGRPALGSDLAYPLFYWGKPLSDPSGGTDRAKGRHPVKMTEPRPAANVPEQVIFTIASPLEVLESVLRLYGKPDLLRIAASINGDDFVPFQEGVIIKRPGEGRSFAWHQDGTTHWDSPDWDQHIHGVNFMPQLYRSTPANGVWFVPGTQKQGRVDIKAMVEAAGSERLPGAVPLVCEAGDMAISNRQVLHGSFANTSPDIRVTLGMGFHPRASVVGVTGFKTETGENATYDAAWVEKRSEAIGYAIAARQAHFREEAPYRYQPHADRTFEWNEAARAALAGYSDYDLRI